MSDFCDTGSQKIGKFWGCIHSIGPEVFEKIERMQQLIAKNTWSGGLVPLSTILRKDIGRASCFSAPLIPTTLRKLSFDNFQGFLRYSQKFWKFKNENEGNIFQKVF